MKSQLKKQLDYVNASRESRGEFADEILGNPNLFLPLLEIGLQTHTDLGSRACWIVEFAFKKRPELLYPNLELFTGGLSALRKSSSIRPMAKICELLTLSYYKGMGGNPPPLTRKHREDITAACFDWLLKNEKVASKAYSMQALLLLGLEFDWIHPELKAIVEQHYAAGSPAYQARARHILRKLK